jgi:hypothetical protein
MHKSNPVAVTVEKFDGVVVWWYLSQKITTPSNYGE